MVMERKKIDVPCIQETRWEATEGSGDGKWIQTLLHVYVEKQMEEMVVGILLSPGMKEGVMEINRESSRLISTKVNVDGCPLNVVCAYAPQVGYDEEEKEDFWGLLEDMMLPNTGE